MLSEFLSSFYCFFFCSIFCIINCENTEGLGFMNADINQQCDYSLKIGCHLSCARGYFAMGKEALALGANVFQFFSRNPRGTKAKQIKKDDVDELKTLLAENSFGKLLVHAPYTLNICSDNTEVSEITERMIAEDLRTIDEYLPGNLYNLHPGCRKERSLADALETAANLLNNVIDIPKNTVILLETMSGKGSEVGATFEQLRDLIAKIKSPEKIGICLDTCHVFSAGYDIVNDLDGVLERFDRIIGLRKLYAIHLNDSLMPFGAHKDRHAPLGVGMIGIEALARLVKHPLLRNLPFYLETPDNGNAHRDEIRLIRSLYGG